ncbi:uncharacterized protein LOC122871894 [Siniperca chuatsi]|uniref:uncharacterized protein LOC122871894 n=1 Tax=Siniperca chuatsi TaxID=119488 RepID=UPI001CE1263A|nr:uncharacterized protein LOC122871894 [Siniperca chuatsi]
MMLAEVGCTVMGFILYISADEGLSGQATSICALRGSSVDLPCSAHPTSSKKWYTVHWVDYEVVQKELSTDGNRVTCNMSEGSNFTLTINDLRESDEDVYYCRENTENSWLRKLQLHVADLQVKVIPTTEGQTVTLMCSTSCPLTENPAAYIWYKNREFLYEDWSPWYQQLVSSDEAVRYSCAIKGYEDLRAPEVSVDSVSPTCFNVTYAKGRMCSYKQKSEDEPCSITYPREVHVQRTHSEGYVTLTCTTSCPLTDPQTTYRWYQNRQLHRYIESQQFSVSRSSDKVFSCAVKGHEDLLSAEVCSKDKNCRSVNYVSRRICALQSSSVNISSKYLHPDNMQPKSKLWYKIKRSSEEDAENVIEAAGRVEYRDNMKNHHMLRIKKLMKNDSAEYTFRHLTEERGQKLMSDLPGVTLVITGLKVTLTPSAVVTEGQRVTLTCSTSCPLTDNTIYIWYLNSRPLTRPENQNKHLVLDPVSSQHAGNYSCAVKTHNTITSHEMTLTVQARGKSMAILNAVRITVVLLIPCSLLLFHLWMRKKKTLTSTDEPNDKGERSPMRTSHC